MMDNHGIRMPQPDEFIPDALPPTRAYCRRQEVFFHPRSRASLRTSSRESRIWWSIFRCPSDVTTSNSLTYLDATSRGRRQSGGHQLNAEISVSRQAPEPLYQQANLVAATGVVQEMDFIDYERLQMMEDIRSAANQGVEGLRGGNQEVWQIARQIGAGLRVSKQHSVPCPARDPGCESGCHWASARVGTTYTTDRFGQPSPTHRSARGAAIASVLPDAVGAVTTRLLPFRIEGMASSCVRVSRPNRAKKGVHARLSMRLTAESSL